MIKHPQRTWTGGQSWNGKGRMTSDHNWIEKIKLAIRPVAQQTTTAQEMQAVVVVILRVNNGAAEVLFIKRAEAPEDPWSGHIAFPGGRVEPEDASLTDAAIRETLEEVEIDLTKSGTIIGELDPVTPSSPYVPKILVTPLVAIVRSDVIPRIGPEVEQVFWMSLHELKRTGRSETVVKVIGPHSLRWPAYASPYGPIWGLTERILTQLLSLVEE